MYLDLNEPPESGEEGKENEPQQFLHSSPFKKKQNNSRKRKKPLSQHQGPQPFQIRKISPISSLFLPSIAEKVKQRRGEKTVELACKKRSTKEPRGRTFSPINDKYGKQFL